MEWQSSLAGKDMYIPLATSMQSGQMPLITKSPPLLTRLRFQLIGALFFCVFLPSLVRWPDVGVFAAADTVQNTLFGASMAIVAGFFVMRRFGDLPGVQSGASILVSYTVPFGIVMMAFLLLRLEYSRYVLASSYALSIGWFVVVHALRKRFVIPRLAVVPGGNASALLALPGAEWKVLTEPGLAGGGVSGIAADLRFDHSDEWDRFLADCALAGIPVYHTKQLAESLTGKVAIEHLSENTFGSLLPDMVYLKAKQVLDFVLAVAALPFFLLVLAVVGPLTIMSSGWPVFFLQERVGYGGRVFKVYKFRTMRAAPAQDARDAAITRDGDSRITPVGRVLRRYRIDELPQIINILRGEMSWIGPRPEALTLSKWYESELPFYRYRHVVRPGISGWAQVNQGHVASPDEVLEKLHYDFFYIKNVSPWLDLVIALKTLRTVLFGFGAK